MTVKELIAELTKYPDDMEVVGVSKEGYNWFQHPLSFVVSEESEAVYKCNKKKVLVIK